MNTREKGETSTLAGSWLALHRMVIEGPDQLSDRELDTFTELNDVVDKAIEQAGACKELAEAVDEAAGILPGQASSFDTEPMRLMLEFQKDVIERCASKDWISEMRDGREKFMTSRVFGIPVFGVKEAVLSLSTADGFVQLVRQSGLVPVDSNVILMGATPMVMAIEALLDPQSVFDAEALIRKAMIEMAAGEEDDGLISKARSILGIMQGPGAEKERAGSVEVGGYIVVGAYLSFEDEQDDALHGIEEMHDRHYEAWGRALGGWIAVQPGYDDQVHIEAPTNLHQAVVEGMATHIIQSVLIHRRVDAISGDEEPELAACHLLADENWTEDSLVDEELILVAAVFADGSHSVIPLFPARALFLLTHIQDEFKAMGLKSEILPSSMFHEQVTVEAKRRKMLH